MATSGTTTFSVTELDIIEEALSDIGKWSPGDAVQGNDLASVRRKLNMLVKQWVAQADFAPGLKMWTRRRGYLFLQKDQIEYEIAVDKGAESYVSTTIAATEAAGQTTITLSSATGVSGTNIVGIELDTGYIQWTTVTSVSAPDIVIPASGLTSQASAGNRVFAYATTATLRNPFQLDAVMLRDTDGTDMEVDHTLNVRQYESIARKSDVGTPMSMYFEPKLGKAKVFLDCAPDDVTDVLRIVYQAYVEDLTAVNETVDFPQEWFRPLAAQLACDIAPMFDAPITPELKMKRDESLRMAQNAHPATSEAYYQSCPDEY